MQAKFSIPQHAIKAVAYAMAVKDIRSYLNGMLIQHNGQETRLIAAAPELLNALKLVANEFNSGDYLDSWLHKQVLSAIAKATGE